MSYWIHASRPCDAIGMGTSGNVVAMIGAVQSAVMCWPLCCMCGVAAGGICGGAADMVEECANNIGDLRDSSDPTKAMACASVRKGQSRYQWRLAAVRCLLIGNISNSCQVRSPRPFLQCLCGLRPNMSSTTSGFATSSRMRPPRRARCALQIPKNLRLAIAKHEHTTALWRTWGCAIELYAGGATAKLTDACVGQRTCAPSRAH